MPSLTLKVSPQGDLHRKLCSRLQQRVRWAEQSQSTQHQTWKQAEESMLAYIPTSAADNRRETGRDRGEMNYTTIVLPYSYAVAMSAHTYWTSVFFARTPIFQFTGRHGETQQSIMAVEALVDYQTQVGGHIVPYYSWLFDKARYGFSVLGVAWEKEIRHIATIGMATSPGPEPDLFGNVDERDRKELKVEEVTTFEGNKVFVVNPYDWLPDPRVPMQRFQEGEFVAVRRKLPWNQVKFREYQGYYTNIERIRSSHGVESSSYQGSSAVERPENQWFIEKEYSTEGHHPSMVACYEVYVELIPSEWGIGKRDYPEKWVFTITADFGLVIGATPLGYYHNRFPFLLLELEPDAHASYSRGYPQIMRPLEQTMSFLLNAHFYNIRASLQNLFLVDPSRVNIDDLEDPLPGGIIRIREAALGTDVRTAFHQLQIQDITQNNLRDIGFMQSIGERVGGVNEQIMGALSGSNRKTATEVRTSTGFGVNRLKTSAEFSSAMGLNPLAQMLLQNTQQYYSLEQTYRIAGDLMGEAQRYLQVKPEMIQGFYDYVPVDGTLPIDRLAMGKMWQEMLLAMRAVPELALEYDVGRMFAWVASLLGMRNITQFKVDLMDPEQIQKKVLAGQLMQQPNGGGRTSGSRGPQGPLNVGNNANGTAGPMM